MGAPIVILGGVITSLSRSMLATIVISGAEGLHRHL
jgi:hypothetical protein